MKKLFYGILINVSCEWSLRKTQIEKFFVKFYLQLFRFVTFLDIIREN